MEVNLLEYGAIGAFIFVVLLFLKNIAAERRDRRAERELFVQIITNHIEHDRQAKDRLAAAITELGRCLGTRPCLMNHDPRSSRVPAPKEGAHA